MTKKVLLERIKKLEEVVGSESCWGLPTQKLGWVIQSLSKEIDTLRETQNLLLEYLKLEVKTIPGTPERKEIRVIPPVNVVSGGVLAWGSCGTDCDNSSTPTHQKKSSKLKEKSLRK